MSDDDHAPLRPTRPDVPHPGLVADRLAIADTIALYCRGIDRFDRALVASCFHHDATDTHGTFHGTVEEFVTWAFRLLERYDATMHLVANHLATFPTANGDRPAVAVAETYGIAFHRSSDPDPRRNLTVGFRYLDRFERRDDGPWLIARRIATTEWVRAARPDEAWPIPEASAIGRRDGDDPLFALLAELDR